MGGFLRRNELNAFVSHSPQVNAFEQSLTPAQQDRRDGDVQLIDEARTKIYCWIVLTPPPMRTSIPFAASRARSSAS